MGKAAVGSLLSEDDPRGFLPESSAGLTCAANCADIDIVMPVKCKAFLLFVIIAAVTAIATAGRTVSFAAAEKYARVSNKELQSQALRLVKNLRDIAYSYNKKDKELLVEYNANYLATRTTERQAVRDQWRKKSEEVLRSSVRDYQQKFLADSISLRDELSRRLPKRLRRPDTSNLYKNPPNVLAIEAIADDLELLAKSLPDT
jgi:hypothetical protein